MVGAAAVSGAASGAGAEVEVVRFRTEGEATQPAELVPETGDGDDHNGGTEVMT